MLGLVGEMRVTDGSENGVMAEELLYLDQIDAGLDHAAYTQFMLLMFAPGHMAVYAEQRTRPALGFLPDHQSST